VVQVGSLRISYRELIGVTLSEIHRESRIAVRTLGYDEPVPVDDAGLAQAAVGVNAYAIATPQFDGRPNVRS
jgi:hypothetical protein